MIDWLTDPSFQAVNRLFVLSFENAADRTVHTKYSLSTVEIKDYNIIIDRLNFFDQLAKKKLKNIITFKILWLVKEMIAWLVVCKIKIILINTIKW